MGQLKDSELDKIVVDTFYEHHQFGFLKSKWSINLPFLCVKCGNCCTLASLHGAGLELIGSPTDQQVKDMNEKLGRYKKTYAKQIEASKDFADIKCPFHLSDNTCEVYSFRPSGCKDFPKTDAGMDTEEGFCEPLDRFKR